MDDGLRALAIGTILSRVRRRLGGRLPNGIGLLSLVALIAIVTWGIALAWWPLVLPYWILLAWVLLAPERRPREGSPHLAGRPDLVADPAEMPTGLAARSIQLQGNHPMPTVLATTEEPGGIASGTTRRPRARRRTKPRPEPQAEPCVTWVRAGAGKFIRVELPHPPGDVIPDPDAPPPDLPLAAERPLVAGPPAIDTDPPASGEDPAIDVTAPLDEDPAIAAPALASDADRGPEDVPLNDDIPGTPAESEEDEPEPDGPGEFDDDPPAADEAAAFGSDPDPDASDFASQSSPTDDDEHREAVSDESSIDIDGDAGDADDDWPDGPQMDPEEDGGEDAAAAPDPTRSGQAGEVSAQEPADHPETSECPEPGPQAGPEPVVVPSVPAPRVAHARPLAWEAGAPRSRSPTPSPRWTVAPRARGGPPSRDRSPMRHAPYDPRAPPEHHRP